MRECAIWTHDAYPSFAVSTCLASLASQMSHYGWIRSERTPMGFKRLALYVSMKLEEFYRFRSAILSLLVSHAQTASNVINVSTLARI